jgi:cysteine synthase
MAVRDHRARADRTATPPVGHAAPPPVGHADVIAARELLAGVVTTTPLAGSRALTELCGGPVVLKCENLQRTGSFKIRGAYTRIARLDAGQRARGVVAASAGNHAQGVALAARMNGIRAVVVMAENATPSKIAATRAYGAEVVLHGTIWDEANEKAKEIVEREGLTYVHPFDDPDLIAGQATLGLEIYEDWPEVEIAVVPIGGGGLISGIATAAKALRPHIEVVEAMAKLSGTDLAGFESQLKTTRMFYTPKDALVFMGGPEMSKVMDLVRTFCFEHNLLGEKVKSKDAIGIEVPGNVLGSKKNVKLRFDPTYMKLAADGKL